HADANYSVLMALFFAARLRAFYREGVTAVKQVSRALTATRNGPADFFGIQQRNAHLVALDVARDVFGHVFRLVRPELHDASLEPESLRRHANWGDPKTWFSDPQAAGSTLLEKLQPLDLSELENEIQIEACKAAEARQHLATASPLGSQTPGQGDLGFAASQSVNAQPVRPHGEPNEPEDSRCIMSERAPRLKLPKFIPWVIGHVVGPMVDPSHVKEASQLEELGSALLLQARTLADPSIPLSRRHAMVMFRPALDALARYLTANHGWYGE